MRRLLHASVCASLQSAISILECWHFCPSVCHFAILWLNAYTYRQNIFQHLVVL